jgi:hypothetical protein
MTITSVQTRTGGRRRDPAMHDSQGRDVESVVTSLPGDEDLGHMRILVCRTDGTVTECGGSLLAAGEKARGWGLTRVRTADHTIQWARDTGTFSSH